MTEKFTKGPWIVREEPSSDGHPVISPVGGYAICQSWNQGETYDANANAALIAAAPEMYEALNELQQLFRDDLAPGYIYACKDVLKNADAALKKARGE